MAEAVTANPLRHRSIPFFSEGILFAFIAGFGYWLAAYVGLAFIPASGGITPVWPPNGLIIGLLLISRPRRWPWILAGVAAACMGANLTAARALDASVGFTVANLLEIFAGAWVFRHYFGGESRFETRREVGLLAAITIPLFACLALFGAAVAWTLLDGDLQSEWQKWWLGDAVGTLIIVPVVVRAAAAWNTRFRLRPKRIFEAAGLFAAHVVVCALAFVIAPVVENDSLLSTAIYPYLSLVTLLFIALRLGPTGSVLACMVATGFALLSQFPLIAGDLVATADVRTIISNQVFLAVSALLGLYVAAQREENRHWAHALTASEERFRSLAMAAPVGIFVTGTRGEVTYVNETSCEIAGRTAAELAGNGGLDAFHPEDRERVGTLWRECIQKRKEFRSEYRFMRPDGTVSWCIGLASPLYDSRGRFLGFVGTVTDNTANKLAELRVRESEGRFRDLADATPTMIWITNRDGLIEYVNGAWLQFRGARMHTEIGQSARALVAQIDGPAAWDEALRDGMPFSGECSMRRVDGEFRSMLVEAAPRRTADGEFLGHVGICLDITPLREAEEARIAMSARLQEAARAESIMVLAGGVAHEFNNILTAVLCNSNLAQLESGLSETVRDHLCGIEEGAIRAADLTRKLLAYSGRGSAFKSLQFLTSIVEDTLPLLKASLPRNTQIHVQTPRDLPGAVLDAAAVQQVFANLFTNAVEALPEGEGNVRVSTGSRIFDAGQLAPHATGESLLPGYYVYLQVSDDGCGIPPENLSRILEPFYSTKFLGRGLGLAAVQGIMREHGGFLQVTSTPGRGTTVSAYFPASGRPVGTRAGVSGLAKA